MYRIDIANKRAARLIPTRLGDIAVRERFDLQEWIEKSPDILGEDLLIISKELILPSGKRLDLLAIDRQANLVVVELKRDDSGGDVEMQAIRYASYISNLTIDDINTYFAAYLQMEKDQAHDKIEKFVDELDTLNQNQRIILVAREFNPEVVSAILWLRDFQVDIKCVRLGTYLDEYQQLFIVPDTIIPLPEAKDYVERKEVKQREIKQSGHSSFSLEVGNFDEIDLEKRLRETFARDSGLTPRLIAFLEILLSEDRQFKRDPEIIDKLMGQGIGIDREHTGRLMSGISQYLTKKSTPHLRQVIQFSIGGSSGERKDDYQIVSAYRPLLARLVGEWQLAHSANETSGETEE